MTNLIKDIDIKGLHKLTPQALDSLGEKIQRRIHALEESIGIPLTGQDPKEKPAESSEAKSGKDSTADGRVSTVSATHDMIIYDAPCECIPVRADVRAFDWKKLYSICQFDVIVMDPPWQLAGAAPTRGVALGYDQLKDDQISFLPLPKLQSEGFLFVWVINAKYEWAVRQLNSWGYRLVDTIDWVKATVNRRLAKGHGFYLQHAKETCLVGKKGNVSFAAGASDVIWAERQGQSQKPNQLYELIERAVPNGRYLEIFARKNNLRDYWVSVGLEL